MDQRLSSRALTFLTIGLLLAGLLLPRPGASLASGSASVELRFDPTRVEFIDRPDGSAARYPGAIAGAPAGAADLPVMQVWVELEPGVALARLEIEPVETIDLGTRRVALVPPARRPGETIHTPSSRVPAPSTPPWAEIGIQGSMRGHRFGVIRIHPLRWDAETGRLVMAQRILVRYHTRPDAGATVLPRHRLVPAIEKRFTTALQRFTTGSARVSPAPALKQIASAATVTPVAGPGPYQPTFRPTTDGSPVEYVIVTKGELAPEFERLAEWKTRKGVQAAVRTVEWINATYPNGADQAERVRFFIRDAYQNWGTLFVLLGGDTDVIPPRYASIKSPLTEKIPADMYYSCLEGNWNGDEDSEFGEGIKLPDLGDGVDLFYEVIVGRAPVSTLQQAQEFVDKVLLYEITAPSNANYPPSFLALAERLFEQTHGADYAEDAILHLPPWFKVVRLYEESASYPGSIELTHSAAVDSSNNGFGMTLHIGHGYRNTMSIGSASLGNSDIDALTNSPRNGIVFAINCSSASIDFNSIGERWVKNPNGGSVAYVGTSRLAYVSPALLYQDQWFNSMYGDSVTTVGLTTELARAAIASDYDGPARWNLLATTLLGDPEVDMYTNEILPLAVAHPGTIALDAGNVAITVTSSGSAVEGATVTLFKDGEAYAKDLTDSSGDVTLAFAPATVGDAALTVHKGNYRVYEATVPVLSTSSPHPFILTTPINDDNVGPSSGDGDGLADAGETIELFVVVQNGGGGALNGATGTLTADDPQGALTILSGGPVSYGTLNPGGSSSGSGAFLIAIDADAPVAYQPILTLSLSAVEGAWTIPFPLPIRRPHIEHYEHLIDDTAGGDGDGFVESGEAIVYTVDLRNSGLEAVESVTANLVVLDAGTMQPHGDVTVTDATASFGNIAAGQIVTGDAFAFSLGGSADPVDVLLEITVQSPPYADFVETLDVVQPAPPTEPSSFGAPTTITITWINPKAPDIFGYDIYRSDDETGPFTRINTYTVEGSSTFEDYNLQALTRYYYEIVTRDDSHNSSSPSTVVSATTNPPQLAGWPVELAQQTSASPTIADLDSDGIMEILTAADMQYAWHFDGNEVVDGDGDAGTNGPFALDGQDAAKGFAATQAVGDVDGDGDLEIANVGWAAQEFFLWDHNGNLLFSKPVLSNFNWGSPAMADLDGDGDLELIVWPGHGGRVFAWHHNGTELVDGDNDPGTDGVLIHITEQNPRFNYGSPAIGNLDGDPQLEIVVPVNLSDDNSGGLYAVNIDGSLVSGWPVFTWGQVPSAPAMADLDKDGDTEVIVVVERQGGRVFVIHHDGTIDPNWDPIGSPVAVGAYTPTGRLPSPSLGDLDDDHNLDIVVPGTDGQLYAFDRSGNALPGFPVSYLSIGTQATMSTASLADVDGDERLEILFGDEKGKVHGYNHDGTELDGFPIQTNGEVQVTPAVWDVDGDGLVEVVGLSLDANVYVWDLPAPFNALRAPWPFFRHDTRNTGNTATTVMEYVTGVDPQPAPGVPAAAMLHRAVPNPFNPSTRIAFDIPDGPGGRSRASLAIYDLQGRLVRQLLNGVVDAGRHAATWDGRGHHGLVVSSGVYFVQLRVGDFVGTSKLVMVR